MQGRGIRIGLLACLAAVAVIGSLPGPSGLLCPTPAMAAPENGIGAFLRKLKDAATGQPKEAPPLKGAMVSAEKATITVAQAAQGPQMGRGADDLVAEPLPRDPDPLGPEGGELLGHDPTRLRLAVVHRKCRLET